VLSQADRKTVAIKKGRERYAALIAERLPTSAEIAEHVSAIDRINRGEQC
jgi:hypothetical protein